MLNLQPSFSGLRRLINRLTLGYPGFLQYFNISKYFPNKFSTIDKWQFQKLRDYQQAKHKPQSRRRDI